MARGLFSQLPICMMRGSLNFYLPFVSCQFLWWLKPCDLWLAPQGLDLQTAVPPNLTWCWSQGFTHLIHILLPKIQILGKVQPAKNKHPNPKISLCRTRTEATNLMLLWSFSLFKDHVEIVRWNSPTCCTPLKLPTAASPQAWLSHPPSFQMFLCTITWTFSIRILSRMCAFPTKSYSG